MTVIVGAAEGAIVFDQSYADPASPTPTAKMTRMRHTMLADGSTQVVLHFAHWTQFESRWLSGVKATQPLSIAATVEVVGAGVQSLTRGTVSAKQTLTLAVDGTATLTFDLPAPVAKGAHFYSNVYVTAPTAGGQAQIPRGSALSAERAEGWEVNGTDKTLTGVIPAPLDGGQSAYGPVRVDVIVPGDKVPSVALIGDSIMAPRFSPWQRALNDLLQPHVGAAVAGDAAFSFKLPAENTHRLSLIADCDIVLCEYGANDVPPSTANVAAQMVPNFVTVWTQLSKGGTRPVWQTTTTPHTEGNTATPSNVSASLVVWNTWLRAGAPLVDGAYAAPGTSGAKVAGQTGHPLRGVLEVADLAETARNSGVWRSTGGAWTVDGLHPTDLGQQSIGAALDLTALLASAASGVVTIGRWDGSALQPVTIGRWDGSTLQPVTLHRG